MSRDALEALVEMLEPHAEHSWEKIGRCVYCQTCGTRLYEGDLPDEKKGERPRRASA